MCVCEDTIERTFAHHCDFSLCLFISFLHSGPNNHDGNVKFRNLVHAYKMRYMLATKTDKPKVAREVVRIWRNLKPKGRFLDRLDNSKKGPGSIKDSHNVWYDVGDKKAREKASQCLRELTPDVLPIIKHLSLKNVPNFNMPSPPKQQVLTPPSNMPPVVPPLPPIPTFIPGVAAAAAAAAPAARTPKMVLLSQPSAAARANAVPVVPVIAPTAAAASLPHPYFAAAPSAVYMSPLAAAAMPFPSTAATLTGDHKIELDVSQMSELEYQQHMLLIQHSIVQQQYQVQRLQQSLLLAQEQRKRHELSRMLAATRKHLK